MVIKFFVLSMSVFAMMITIILMSKRGHEQDEKNKLIKSISEREGNIKLDDSELEKSFYHRFFAPVVEKLFGVFESNKKKREEKNNQIVDEKKIAKIQQTEKLLRMSGTHTSYQNYNFYKIAFALLFSVCSIGVALILNLERLYTVCIIGGGLLFAVVLPDFFLKSKVKSHQNAIKAQLPDVLDLLSVCTEAGLSFDGALLKVIEKMEGAFIDELMTVFRQMQMGVPRTEALEMLSDCTDIPELKTFVSAVAQSSTLGIPINNVLKVQAQQIRDTKRENAKTKGNKAASAMAIPTLCFIFPALFIVILGPTVISVIKSMT